MTFTCGSISRRCECVVFTLPRSACHFPQPPPQLSSRWATPLDPHPPQTQTHTAMTPFLHQAVDNNNPSCFEAVALVMSVDLAHKFSFNTLIINPNYQSIYMLQDFPLVNKKTLFLLMYRVKTIDIAYGQSTKKNTFLAYEQSKNHCSCLCPE